MTLNTFEGRDVAQATMRIVGAGDGLSNPLGIQPVEYHVGDTVRLVVEGHVSRVAHDPIKDTDLLQRVHTVKADLVVIVDVDTVAGVLEDQRAAIEAAQGVQRLPLDGE